MRERSVVLDASALLAVAHGEPGATAVAPHLESAAMSAVNWTEVIESRIKRGILVGEVRAAASEAGVSIVPLDAAQAELAAELRTRTEHRGLSLADRACLALARSLNLPAMTADRSWDGLDVGVEIQMIR